LRQGLPKTPQSGQGHRRDQAHPGRAAGLRTTRLLFNARLKGWCLW
jgi:hypothetical protein